MSIDESNNRKLYQVIVKQRQALMDCQKKINDQQKLINQMKKQLEEQKLREQEKDQNIENMRFELDRQDQIIDKLEKIAYTLKKNIENDQISFDPLQKNFEQNNQNRYLKMAPQNKNQQRESLEIKQNIREIQPDADDPNIPKSQKYQSLKLPLLGDKASNQYSVLKIPLSQLKKIEPEQVALILANSALQ